MTLSSYLFSPAVNAYVTVISRGHFPDTVMVAHNGKSFEMYLRDLKYHG